MAKYRCKVCGYIYDSINIDGRDQIPVRCPVCGAFQSAFILIQPSEFKRSYYFNLFSARLVDFAFCRNQFSLHHRPVDLATECRKEKDVKKFLRYKFGWWILHLIAVSFTLYLAYVVDFSARFIKK